MFDTCVSYTWHGGDLNPCDFSVKKMLTEKAHRDGAQKSSTLSTYTIEAPSSCDDGGYLVVCIRAC